ncbi:hypothetical protein D9M72_545930 [compost metagenome]
MGAELTVLRHHHRLDEHRRDVLEIDPLAVVAAKQNEIAQHQGGDRVDELDEIENDQHIGQGNETQDSQDDLAAFLAQRPAKRRPATGRHFALLARFRNDVHGLTVHLAVHPLLLVHGPAKLNGLSGKRQGAQAAVPGKARRCDTNPR